MASTPYQEKFGGLSFSGGKVRSPPGCSRVVQEEGLLTTPGSARSGRSSLSDEAMCVRLREAGFDQESIKKRDKAALIGYIARLESEVYDYQHHMGLLILEKKDWTSQYEQVKTSSDLAETQNKLDKAASLSALAEARKREESLKRALAIEKECIANIEKTLHEMRAESAETKIAVESKMAEALDMLENAQKKFKEAETKMQAANFLEEEVSRFHRAAQRKLEEVKEREDELRRQLITFKSECDAKEEEISLERQSLSERQKLVQQEQERLLGGQASLNQREEYVSGRYLELSRVEKELEALKVNIEKEYNSLNEDKINLELNLTALATREKAVEEKEEMLDKKERELLSLQEKVVRKEYDEVQRLVAKEETAQEIRKYELEAEMEQRRRSIDDEIENKRRVCELREVDLRQREESIQEREHELEVHSWMLLEKEKDATNRLKALQEKENNLNAAEEAKELEKSCIQKEKEEIRSMKLGLDKSMTALEKRRKEVEQAQEKLEASKCERNELLDLEMKLKDEIDSLRAQKLELMGEAEELIAEKSKFETEWELIDDKRLELQREAENISKEREKVSKFLKDERDRLKEEKDALHDQFRHDLESISREREAFVSKMGQERSELFSNIQQERANFFQDIELQKSELENCIEKRRDEIETYLRAKEETFEEEKAKELHCISSMKEIVAKELENVESEKKKLDNERLEISLDRKEREKELQELKISIEELHTQKEKLKEQRELLHEDRERIDVRIQHLSNLEGLKIDAEDLALSEIMEADLKSARQNFKPKRRVRTILKDVDLDTYTPKETLRSGRLLPKQVLDSAPFPSSTTFSWIKKCTELIFKHSPEKPSSRRENSLISEFGVEKFSDDNDCQDDKLLAQSEDVQGVANLFERQMSEEKDGTDNIFCQIQPLGSLHEEPRLILEVPSVDDEKAKSGCLEADAKTQVLENSVHLCPEEEVPVGRKRANSFSHGNADVLLKRRCNKKRKQVGNAIEVPFEEETTSNCASAVSTPPILKEEEDGSISLEQTAKSMEQISDCANGNHNSLEDITESNNVKTFERAVKQVSSQNLASVSDQDDDKGRGSDGYACSPVVGNGRSAPGVKRPKSTRSVRGK